MCKRWRWKVTCKGSLCGWKLSFQLAKRAVIRCIHLSGPVPGGDTEGSLLLPRALSGLQLFSDPDISQPLHLSIQPTAEERADTLRHAALSYSLLAVFTSNKLTQTRQGDTRSSLGLKLSNCHLHQTCSEERRANCSCGFLKPLAHHGSA